MATVHLVGVGPGDPSFVTPRVRAILQEVDRVVGWDRNFQPVDDFIPDGVDRDIQTVDNYESVFEEALERASHGMDLAVLKIGDPTISSGLGRVIEKTAAHSELTLRIYPGISSVQIVAARAGIDLHRSAIASFHDDDDRNQAEREFLLDAWAHERHLILLSGPQFRPDESARYFMENGIDPETATFVGSQLTWSAEDVFQTTLGAVVDQSYHWLTTMAVLYPEILPPGHPRTD